MVRAREVLSPRTSDDVAPCLVSYLATEVDRQRRLKHATIAALVAHFVVLLVVLPRAPVTLSAAERASATIVRTWSPPRPPATAPSRSVRRAPRVPVPMPVATPNLLIDATAVREEPGAFDATFALTSPDSAPGRGHDPRASAVAVGSRGLTPPQVLRRANPEYTPAAARRGLQGTVLIEAVVGIDGSVTAPVLLRGLADPDLNQGALEAVQRWVFRPGMRDGRPVPVVAVFEVVFKLH